MHKSNPKYNEWQKRTRDANEKKRTRGRKSGLLMGGATGKSKKSKSIIRIVPTNFSILENPEEVITFFNVTRSIIAIPRYDKNSLVFNFSLVTNITIDAIMYLIATIISAYKPACGFTEMSGNEPRNPEARDALRRSGFMSFVRSPLSSIESTTKIVQIKCDNAPDIDRIIEICDFAQEIYDVTKLETQPIYELILELSKNVFDHAYEKDVLAFKRRDWFSYVEQDKTGLLKFTFLDTGYGIWNTMQKKWGEKLLDLFFNVQHDAVLSALDGEFRTSTMLPYRGNGLPKVKQQVLKERITGLRIVTNQAFCYSTSDPEIGLKGRDLSTSLKGTVYYWEISKDMIMYRNQKERIVENDVVL